MVDRLFYLFHKNWSCSIEELNEIIEFGIKNGDLVITDMDKPDKYYNEIDWNFKKAYQEILMVDIYKYMPLLFNENPQVSDEYKQFITE